MILLRIIGKDNNNTDGEEQQGVNEIDVNKQIQITWELLQSEEGQSFLAENAAKNCYIELTERLDMELSQSQIKLIKVDIMNECQHIIRVIPYYLMSDFPICKRLLHSQLSTQLGLLVERLEFKYKVLLLTDSFDFVNDNDKD